MCCYCILIRLVIWLRYKYVGTYIFATSTCIMYIHIKSPGSLGHFTPPFDASIHHSTSMCSSSSHDKLFYCTYDPTICSWLDRAYCCNQIACASASSIDKQFSTLITSSTCTLAPLQSHHMRQPYIWLVLGRLKPLLLDLVSLTQRIIHVIKKTGEWLYHTWHLYRFPFPYRKNHTF